MNPNYINKDPTPIKMCGKITPQKINNACVKS